MKAFLKVCWKTLRCLCLWLWVATKFSLKQLWRGLKPLLQHLGHWIKVEAKKHPGGTGSLVLHFVIILSLLGGIDIFFEEKKEPIRFVSIELLPIKEITNIKPKEIPQEPIKSPVEEVKPKPPPPKPKAEKPKPKPKDKPKIKVAEKPKTETKPAAIKPKEKPKPEKPETDFASVLKHVEDIKAQQNKKPAPQNYDPTKPLSMSEIDAIIHQISQCWTVPAGIRNAQDMAVTLRISLAKDGSAKDVTITDQSRYNNETFFRAAADSAKRAVHKCSPLKNLPPDKYTSWSEMELTFDPKELLY